MKKIIFLFLILFMSISTTNAAEVFYLGDQIPDQYIEVLDYGRYHNNAPIILTRSDEIIVYSIDPFKEMNTKALYQSYNYNNPIFNLTNEQLNKLNIISYYGYEYMNHTDIKWYGITQYLIWETLGYESIYFTDIYQGTKIDKYMSEIEELRNLVNDYYKLPSFSNEKYEYNPNTNYVIEDTNNVLSNYEIMESNIPVAIDNNKLIIDTNSSGNYTIKFIRKSPVSRDYLLYNHPDSQSILFPGRIDDVTFDLSIEVISGSITINKYDSENKNRLEATLEGSVFEIYKDNKLINKLSINENGTTNINNLSLGNYTVKEVISSKGYNVDTKTYDITISKTNKDIVINSYSDVIKGNLVINKYYLSDNVYKIDENSLFEVYNNNKLIMTLNGKINEKLEYGTYLIKQVSGKENYNLIEQFNVAILEENEYKYEFYTDKTDEIKEHENLLNKKEEDLNQKEKELLDLEIKLKNEKEELTNSKNNQKGLNEIEEKNVLVVEVPNTYKKSYNKLISIILVLIGSIFIIYSKKKTTHW